MTSLVSNSPDTKPAPGLVKRLAPYAFPTIGMVWICWYSISVVTSAHHSSTDLLLVVPLAVVSLLLVSAAVGVQIVRDRRSPNVETADRSTPPAGDEHENADGSFDYRIPIIAGIAVLAAVLIPIINFWVVATVAVFTMALVLHPGLRRRQRRDVLIVCISCAALLVSIWLIFTLLLGLDLPLLSTNV